MIYLRCISDHILKATHVPRTHHASVTNLTKGVFPIGGTRIFPQPSPHTSRDTSIPLFYGYWPLATQRQPALTPNAQLWPQSAAIRHFTSAQQFGTLQPPRKRHLHTNSPEPRSTFRSLPRPQGLGCPVVAFSCSVHHYQQFDSSPMLTTTSFGWNYHDLSASPPPSNHLPSHPACD